MTLKQYFKAKCTEINKGLESCLPKIEKEAPSLWKSMDYSLFAKGKRLRPILMYAVYESLKNSQMSAVNGQKKVVKATACAIEIVHTSSLILDDFPCMDDGKTRRGKPANHLVFGEATALLAADALLTYAFELIAHEVPDKLGIELIRHLAKAVGTQGMIGGQIVDLQSRGKIINYETLIYIHRHKTAALFEYAARAGALLAQADSTHVDSVVKYAADLGLAYQITDDILDVLETGKIPPNHHPEVNFVSIMGMENAKQKVDELIASAKHYLNRLDYREAILSQIADYVDNRSNRNSLEFRIRKIQDVPIG